MKSEGTGETVLKTIGSSKKRNFEHEKTQKDANAEGKEEAEDEVEETWERLFLWR